MLLTPGEAVLAGALISAGPAALVAVVLSRGGQRWDHVVRLWERRAAVCEDVLFFAGRWSEQRVHLLRVLAGDDSAMREMPDLSADREGMLRLMARLATVGELAVREAFARHQDAELRFAAVFGGWLDCRDANREAVDGGAWPGEVRPDELQERRKRVLEASDAAGRGLVELEEVVRGAVARLPRYRHGLWRRVARRHEI